MIRSFRVLKWSTSEKPQVRLLYFETSEWCHWFTVERFDLEAEKTFTVEDVEKPESIFSVFATSSEDVIHLILRKE